MIQLLLLLSLLLVSCGNPLSGSKGGQPKAEGEFHPGSPNTPATPPTDTEATTPANVGGDSGFKLGPGSMRAAGTATAMKAAITTTDRTLTGTNLKATISFSQRKVR